MTTVQIVGSLVMLWGLATLLVGVLRPQFMWKTNKVQGFVQLIGDKGTTILFSVIGLGAIVGGLFIVFSGS